MRISDILRSAEMLYPRLKTRLTAIANQQIFKEILPSRLLPGKFSQIHGFALALSTIAVIGLLYWRCRSSAPPPSKPPAENPRPAHRETHSSPHAAETPPPPEANARNLTSRQAALEEPVATTTSLALASLQNGRPLLFLYCVRVGSEDLDLLRLREIDLCRRPSQFGNGAPPADREVRSLRFCFFSQSPNLQNLPARSILGRTSTPDEGLSSRRAITHPDEEIIEMPRHLPQEPNQILAIRISILIAITRRTSLLFILTISREFTTTEAFIFNPPPLESTRLLATPPQTYPLFRSVSEIRHRLPSQIFVLPEQEPLQIEAPPQPEESEALEPPHSDDENSDFEEISAAPPPTTLSDVIDLTPHQSVLGTTTAATSSLLLAPLRAGKTWLCQRAAPTTGIDPYGVGADTFLSPTPTTMLLTHFISTDGGERVIQLIKAHYTWDTSRTTEVNPANDYIIVPVVLERSPIRHIIVLMYEKSRERLEIYDSQGKSWERLKSERTFTGVPFHTVVEKLFEQLNFRTITSNINRHQGDIHNCGVYVIRYVQRRLRGEPAERIFANGEGVSEMTALRQSFVPILQRIDKEARAEERRRREARRAARARV